MTVSKRKIPENLAIARQKIDHARKKSGIDNVTVIGITKTRTPEQVADLIIAGCTNVGENRVQEWESKFPEVVKVLSERGNTDKFTKHLVGHLQSNKVRRAILDFDVIQSLDSLKLADRINSIALDENKSQIECLIQVKLGEEDTKSGIAKPDLNEYFEAFLNFERIKVIGLMLIAPLWAIGDSARPYYADMSELFRYFKSREDSRFEMRYLSMGMSADFDIAVEEGANMVRIGRALFDGFENL
jgi:pyridoxal phosphate enzyme (YggS family)